MSIAQVKKRFAEMAEYLNRDNEGLRRLKLLKDEVNTLRTDLATAKEEAQLANTIKDAARERADAAETVVAEMQIYAKSNEIKIQAMSQRVAALSQAINELTHTEEDTEVAELVVPDDPDEAVVKSVIKVLRKKARFCPKAISRKTKGDTHVEVYERTDIAAGWSHEDLWVLGATTAVLSLFLGQVVIFSGKRATDMQHKGAESGMLRNIIQWYVKNNMEEITPSQEKMLNGLAFSNQGRHTSAGRVEQH